MTGLSAELQDLTDEELVERFDHEAKHVQLDLSFLWNELARRRAERDTKAILK